MATNITWDDFPYRPRKPSEDGNYSGDFYGDLHGNAESATKLKQPFSLTLIGDGSGAGSIDGSGNVSISLKITNAAKAAQADKATQADKASTAATADKATRAGYADSSAQAESAKNADEAKHAAKADQATSAASATTAQSASTAGQADQAKEATHAAKADYADKAALAEGLTDTASVPEAAHAKKADLATIAQYDCMGRAIHLTYITQDQLGSQYASKDDLITSAIVQGLAYGTGQVEGQTLKINITSLAGGEAGGDFYGSLAYGTPDKSSDSTKIYLNEQGNFYIYNKEVGTGEWQMVNSPLDPEALAGYAKLDGATFTGAVHVPSQGKNATGTVIMTADDVQQLVASNKPEGYAELKGATFTGAIHAPNQGKDATGTVIMNADDVHALTASITSDFNNTLQNYVQTKELNAYATTSSLQAYAKLSGANFTGNITVPSADAAAAGSTAVLNKTGVQSLITTSLDGYQKVTLTQADPGTYNAGTIYAITD